MISIIMSGMCENCDVADLEVSELYVDYGTSFSVVTCVHERTCLRILNRFVPEPDRSRIFERLAVKRDHEGNHGTK